MHRFTAALVVTLVVPGVIACGSKREAAVEAQPQVVDAQPKAISDRARALATCPAKAPDPIDDVRRKPIKDRVRIERSLDPVLAIARSYLRSLPIDQRGELWLDVDRSRVVIQVAYAADEVLSELRRRVTDPSTVGVELVRYSTAQLRRWARKLDEIWDDIGLSYISARSANGRIEIGVTGDAEQASRRIAQLIDPCAFRVEGHVKIELAEPDFDYPPARPDARSTHLPAPADKRRSS